ncbi:MAG: domain S-box protein, partial [Rhizobacter sp.]|nr:domain S-box protein [Rhizobacter sp.]
MSTADEQALPSWESLYDGSAGGLLLTSPDGTIRLVNDTFCRWIGHAKTDLVGRRRLQDLLTMGGKIFHQTHWAPLLQMQGSIAEVKLEVVHRDGRSIPMVMNAVRRAHPSGLFHEIAALVAEDRHTYERELLAARRRAEELIVRQLQAQDALSLAQAKLRLALGAAKLFVWDVDLATRQRRYEDDVALLIGCSNARSLPDAEYAPCIHPLDREREARTFADAMDAPASGYDCIYRVIGVEGAERVVSSTGRGLFDAQGALLRFVGVLQDVSETSRQRAAMEDRALFAEQMIGIVSHDLRNPLSAIKMGAALLGRGELSTNQTKTLARLNNSAARAQRLIADLLDFTAARIGSGLQLSPTRFELHELVAE